MKYSNDFKLIMQKKGIRKEVIKQFLLYYKLLLDNDESIICEKDICPLSNDKIIFYEDLPLENSENEKIAIIKLNGGLGTSMGLKKAKSLIPVKNGYNFLDIIAKQVLNLSIKTPLIFMNSFNTRTDSLDFLKKYPNLIFEDLQLDFIQNQFPKIKTKNFSPTNFEQDKLNWNPPGHGDIYLALSSSGVLDKLLDKGIKYAFISNSDNLGAEFDSKIFSYFIKNKLDFLMEVCVRTERDSKGGHLTQNKKNKLILREIAQVNDAEIEDFQNIKKHQYFNTNNIWLNLKSLKKNGIPNLPLIKNQKIVEGQNVLQIETAMGSAITFFDKSLAIIVPRSRFLPVKKTEDLLLLWSDIYKLSSDFRLKTELKRMPNIKLNPKFYGTLKKMQDRIKVVPSLKKCKSLTIKKDYIFDNKVFFSGSCIID